MQCDGRKAKRRKEEGGRNEGRMQVMKCERERERVRVMANKGRS